MQTRRMQLALRIAEAIHQRGGSVRSLLPPSPGMNIDFECPSHATEAIVTMLRDNGHRVNPRGTVRRLIPNATIEEVTYRLETGENAVRVVTHAGEANLDAFELVLPSDGELARLIPHGLPPKPKRHRQDKVESERVRRRRARS